MNKLGIDTSFDFTTDSMGYWDNFWENKGGIGASNCDPDVVSLTLQRYHSQLWSRKLPNGETLDLVPGSGANYLTWKDFRFGSDSIIASFRYKRYAEMLKAVEERVDDYHTMMEIFLRRTYTIGGSIIFPKRMWGMNQSRGCNRYICDRWDLTLECIRRFYEGVESPLTDVLEKDKAFFDLFVDFKGYVDFFFLQDCVLDDYSAVILWTDTKLFELNPLPATVDEYLQFLDRELDFVERRNKRINSYLEEYQRSK